MPGYSFEVGKVQVHIEVLPEGPAADEIFAEIVEAMADLYEEDPLSPSEAE